MRIYEDSLKIKQFLMTSYPLKMTSYHSQILLIARFWVDLFEKTVVVGTPTIQEKIHKPDLVCY